MSQHPGPQAHPHILATGATSNSVTHYVCPQDPAGGTHHLVPHSTQRRENVSTTMVCRTCKRNEAQLRSDVGLDGQR